MRAAILAFIGVKLVLHALRENSQPFVDGERLSGVPEVSTPLSLSVIIVLVAVTTVASLLRTHHLKAQTSSSVNAPEALTTTA
jgi:tellurite resistance protein TerC